MPSIFYLDHDLGNDATTNTPLGWWSVPFTGGTQPAPVVDEQVTGATSGSTAKISYITLTSGSWAAGSAAGTMYFYGKSAAFAAEQVNCAGGGHFHIAADFTYCAWQSFKLGSTVARIAAGDTIRVAKNGTAPRILDGATGKATWVSLQQYITLDAAQTLNIDMCETAWTKNPSGDTTVTRTAKATDAKEGAYCMKIQLDASPQTSIMQAYYATGTLSGATLNGYSKLSFWLKNSGAVIANNWYIALCSDTAGATPIDVFPIPPIPSISSWVPLTIARCAPATFVQGGNLGGNTSTDVKSIAIYTGSDVTGQASKYVYIDNFIGCTTNGLNLQSLISKDSAEKSTASGDGWYPIQSINGTTVYLDGDTNTKSQAGRGYYSLTATENVNTYTRETFKCAMASSSTTTNNDTPVEDGTITAPILYIGGWNPMTNLQDGDTWLDGLNSNGYGIQILNVDYTEMWHFSIVRRNYAWALSSHFSAIKETFNCVGNSYAIYTQNSGSCYIENAININNNSYGFYLSGDNLTIESVSIKNCTYYGIYSTSGGRIRIFSGVFCNNGKALVTSSLMKVLNWFSRANGAAFTVGQETEFTISHCDDSGDTVRVDTGNYGNQGRVLINKNASGFSESLRSYGKISSQNATAGGTGLEWLFQNDTYARAADNPLRMVIGRVYCNAGKTTTIGVYFVKSHATQVSAFLLCERGQLTGLTTDIRTNCPDDTNRNLVQISIVNPTESGVVEIEAGMYGGISETLIVDGTIALTES